MRCHIGEMFYVSNNTHVMHIMQLEVSNNKYKLGCQGTSQIEPLKALLKICPRYALQEVAARVEAPLKLAAPFDQYILPPEGFHQLGLAGVHQRVNASLAVQLAATWEQSAGHSCGGSDPAGAAKRAQQVAQLQLPDAYAAGLRQCVWPGRAQVIHTRNQGVRCCCSRAMTA